MQQYKWIIDKIQWYSIHYKKISILPMGKWGNFCRGFLYDNKNVEEILCLDNYIYDNNNIFPVDRDENWHDDFLYLITAENEELCKDIEKQLQKHVVKSHIGKLFFCDEQLYKVYGKVHLDFLCVGFPKCGTTSLHAALSQNPNVFLPKVKETDFINTDYLPSTHKWYKLLYNGSSEKNVIGGVEPEFLLDNSCVEKIYNYYGPNLKLIMCIRNPKKAVYSFFQMYMRQIRQNAEYYMKKYKSVTPEVFDEWILKENYKSVFKYMDYINQFIKYYSKNIKIVIFEELISDTQKVMSEIQDYIGLNEKNKIDYNELPHSNEGSIIPKSYASVCINEQLIALEYDQSDFELREEINRLREKICKTFLMDGFRDSMYDATEQKLDNYYCDSIRELEKFLGKSFRGKWY